MKIKTLLVTALFLSAAAWPQIAPPTLLTPADSAKEIGIRPVLTWLADSAATLYHAQIGADSAFATIEAQDSAVKGASYGSTKTLAYGKTYFWRVRAKDSASWGEFSVTRRLTIVVDPPGVPVPVSPVADTPTTPWPVTFIWKKALYADSYGIQIATDSAFANVVISTRPNDSMYSPGAALPLAPKYWWHVQSRGIHGTSKYCKAQSFTMVAGPAAPVPLTPADGAVDVSDRPTFTWNKIAGVAAYRIELSLDSNFSKVAQSDSMVGDIDTTSKRGLLNNLAVYYWRVRAWDSAGPGPWSPRRSFTTIHVTPPSKPSLVSPVDYQTVTDTFTTVTWKKADRGKSYHVQVAKDQDFTDLVFDFTTTATTEGIAPLDSFAYFWRVSSSNDSGDGPWSSTWHFNAQVPLAAKARVPAAAGLHVFADGAGLSLDFSLPRSASVEVDLIELGRGRSEVLLKGELTAGAHQLRLSGRRTAGWYVLRLRGGAFNEARKIFLP
jgi:hypothetical protein